MSDLAEWFGAPGAAIRGAVTFRAPYDLRPGMPQNDALFSAGGAADVGQQLVRRLIVDAAADQDVDRLNALPVVRAVPVVGQVDQRAIDIHAAVDALCARERDQVGQNVGLGAGAHRTRSNARVTANLEIRSEHRVHALLGHDERYDLGHRYT